MPAGIRQLLDAIELPAFVEDRMFDVLAANRLAIGDSGGQLLVIYHAEPGSDSARAVARLGSLATDTKADTKADADQAAVRTLDA